MSSESRDVLKRESIWIILSEAGQTSFFLSFFPFFVSFFRSDIFLSYIILGSFINLNVALIFAFRLLSMKSPFQRSRGVLFRILAHSFAGNVTSGALAIFIGVLWTSRIDAWFIIPVEILAKVYPCVLLLALLAREDARNEMTDPSRVGAPGVINLRIDTGMELDFLDEDARRRYSCASVELSSSPEEISQFLYYRPDKPRRRRS